MDNKVKLIIDALMDDLLDRHGIGNAIEAVDDDVREDIEAEWFTIIESILAE